MTAATAALPELTRPAAPVGSCGGKARAALWQPARDRFPARPDLTAWPATVMPRGQAQRELGRVLAARQKGTGCSYLRVGPGALLDWLEDQPGATWQERWLASGADQARSGWRDISRRWLHDRGHDSPYWTDGLSVALKAAVIADIVRPSLHWLTGGGAADNHFARELAAQRDPQGFARLRELCDCDPDLPGIVRDRAIHRAAVIVAAKGGNLAQITTGDLIAEHTAECDTMAKPGQHTQVLYGLLRVMGIITGPPAFRQLRSAGPRTPAELIGRYHLACQPIRDLLADYLRERQPALDYSTLNHISGILGKLFWADLEQHPEVDVWLPGQARPRGAAGSHTRCGSSARRGS